MSKLAIAIFATAAAAATATGAALVATTSPGATAPALPTAQAVGTVRPPVVPAPIVIEPGDPPPRPLPIHRPPRVTPPPTVLATRDITLPLCTYDTDVRSSVQLYSDWWNDDYGTAFLCQADVNGRFTGACGQDAASASVCPSSTRGRPAVTHYLLNENLTGLDGAYGQNWSFTEGSAIYGAYDVECRRPTSSQCNDTLTRAHFLGNYIPGNYGTWDPRKVKLFDIDGGVMPTAGKLVGTVDLGWYGTCPTCGPGVGPQGADLVLALQQEQPDGTWIDLRTVIASSNYNATPTYSVQINVEPGKHVRFQVRGEYAGDQPHFAYAVANAKLTVPAPLVGRENHARLCEYEPEALAFNHLFTDPGAAFACHGTSNWNGCSLDVNRHPTDSTYWIRSQTSSNPPLSAVDMSWPDGTVIHGLEEAVCLHSPIIRVDSVYDTLERPAPSTCFVSGSYNMTNLAEIDGGFIEHTRPVTVIGSAKVWGEQWSNVTAVIQVLTPDSTGMVSWQDVATTSTTTGDLATFQPVVVAATVAPYSDVRLQVRGQCGKDYRLTSATIFSECDPTDPFSCNP